jgi:hypothetical protein
MVKHALFFICIILGSKHLIAQKDSIFNPKKEIAYDGKRYRVYNNWISVGGGAGFNTQWPKDEKNLALDYSFHLKQYYFRAGAFMSGVNFAQANNYNFHAMAGIRKEAEKYNLSMFIGPSYSYFRRPLKDSLDYDLTKIYNAFGGYACIEAIYKVKYDIGIGGQIFCDYNQTQMVYGVRLVLYLSSAYRGIKYGYVKPKK